MSKVARRKAVARTQAEAPAPAARPVAAGFAARYPELHAAAAARAAAAALLEHPELRPTTEPALILVPRPAPR